VVKLVKKVIKNIEIIQKEHDEHEKRMQEKRNEFQREWNKWGIPKKGRPKMLP